MRNAERASGVPVCNADKDLCATISVQLNDMHALALGGRNFPPYMTTNIQPGAS